MTFPSAESVIRTSGPWEHREIAANTARFHIVEAGEGPLLLFLHGFPTFWWTWRKQLEHFQTKGFRVVAMDLRGYGGSDKTPHGYDPMTLAADVRGVILALGETRAVVVGQGWGGLLAWCVATMYPENVVGIVPVSMPHPKRLRRSILRDTVQRKALSYIYAFQLPFYPEYRLRKNNAQKIGEILEEWSAGNWPDEETKTVFRAAMLEPAAIHCSLEYHRWALRSIPRKDGRTFQDIMSNDIEVPVLQIHGTLDGSITPKTASKSREFIDSEYEYVLISECGHFPHEEAPDIFNETLENWLAKFETLN